MISSQLHLIINIIKQYTFSRYNTCSTRNFQPLCFGINIQCSKYYDFCGSNCAVIHLIKMGHSFGRILQLTTDIHMGRYHIRLPYKKSWYNILWLSSKQNVFNNHPEILSSNTKITTVQGNLHPTPFKIWRNNKCEYWSKRRRYWQVMTMALPLGITLIWLQEYKYPLNKCIIMNNGGWE